MSIYGRFIGIDVGTKHIGLARTDLLRTVANPIGTYNPQTVFEELSRQITDGKIMKFVVGWPLTPEGEEGKAIKMVKQFITRLENHFPDIEIARFDERYTSKEAADVLYRSGVAKKKRHTSDRINQVAAAIILQKYLEQAEDYAYTTYRYI